MQNTGTWRRPKILKTGWPLLSNDLHFAQKWILSTIHKETKNLRLLHQALSIGLYDDIAKILKDLPITNEEKSTLLYRISLKKGNINESYRSIIHPALINDCQKLINLARTKRNPLNVTLKGGIGDHLEAISIIHAWQCEFPTKIHLSMSDQRKKQLARMIEHLPLISFESKKIYPLNFPVIRHQIIVEQKIVRTKAIFTKPPLLDPYKSGRILCCWRAQAGIGEHLSVHTRSVPADIVFRFYQWLICKYPGLNITDISQWKPWEQKMFLSIGINLHDPSITDVLELANLCKLQNHIISIDTALAHLCAVSNCKAKLLLTKFPDERWSILLQPGNCYQDNLSVIQQQKFGDWSGPLETLMHGIDL